MARAKVACTSSVPRRRTFDGKTRGNKVMDWKQNPASGNCFGNHNRSLKRCDDNDDAQKFHIESYATGKNGHPSWEEVYDAATVVNDCDYCDFGGPAVTCIRSKLDPSMVLSVNRADENAALRIKRVKSSQLSYKENIFSDLEGGEAILGNGEYNYFEDCLFVANQGLTPLT